MTTKHEIEIKGLPEGWKPVAYRCPRIDECYWRYGNEILREAGNNPGIPYLIVEKIQPRRIVLEETEEERIVSYGDWFQTDEGLIKQWDREDVGSLGCFKIWRQVKEGE